MIPKILLGGCRTSAFGPYIKVEHRHIKNPTLPIHKTYKKTKTLPPILITTT